MNNKSTTLVGALCLVLSLPGASEIGCHLATKAEGRVLISADDVFISRSTPSTASTRTTLVQIGGVRVGFTIETGEWKPSKNAKTGGGTGSDRALVHASIIPHGQMKSLSVTTNGNVVTAVWKGHQLCGDNFTVTAKMTLRPDGGFEYTSFGYTGNESGQYPNRIVFPEVVVPRSAGGAVRDRALHF